MSYGFQSVNNSNVVNVDSEFSRLVVIASGRFAPTQESGLGSVTAFPRPVTTQAPPLVFVRPDTTGAIAGLCQMRLIGSPGNWTGFYVRAYNVNTAQPNGRYFVAAFAAQAVSTYGMRLWGADGGLIFDSGTPCAIFTRAFQNWTYVTYDTDAQGLVRIYYKVSFNFPENEYLMINNFGMDMCSGSGIARRLYNWWDFPTGTLWAITVAAANPFAFFLPAVFAKLSV